MGKDKHLYPIVIEALTGEDGGGYVASVPDLPGCMTDGETREEALANVYDAIDSWMEASAHESLEIPEPSMHVSPSGFSGKFMTRISPLTHKRLSDIAKTNGVSQNQLVGEALAFFAGMSYARNTGAPVGQKRKI